MTRLACLSLCFATLAACGSSGGSGASGGDGGGGGNPSDSPGSGYDAPSGKEGGAGPGVDASGDAGPVSDAATPVDASVYADPSLWLCGAGAPHDYCLDAQSVTAIHPDLSQTVTTPTAAASPSLDCFYIYPSVDLTSPAGNEPDFSNLTEILDPVREQAAPFSQVCKVYAPLYHQATYESYYSANSDQYLEVAYADDAAAVPGVHR